MRYTVSNNVRSADNMGNIVYIYLMCNIFSSRLVKCLEGQVMIF